MARQRKRSCSGQIVRGHSICGPQGEVPRPAAASPENPLEEMLRSHLRPVRSDTRGGGTKGSV